MRWWAYRTMDWPLLVAVVGLVTLGILGITSVDLSWGGSFILVQRQLLALATGVILFFILVRVPPAWWRATGRGWYFLGLGLLLAVLFFGNEIRGTRGWFTFLGFSFQPVEFMKVALILVLARIIDRRGRVFKSNLFFFGTAAVVFLPMVLVGIQPDLGSALVLAALWVWLVVFVGTRRGYLFLLLGVTVAAAVLSWFVFLQPYQKDRLRSFLQPQRDPLGAGYNVQQSIIAVGAGQVFGRGFGYGSQNQLNFLPERQTDFIFSVLGEEFGFVGAIALFICYAIIGWRLLRLAGRCRDDFSLMVIFGAWAMWLTQVVVNIGAAVGILPVTGITLPFVSYGGSSLILNWVLLGIVESVASRQT